MDTLHLMFAAAIGVPTHRPSILADVDWGGLIWNFGWAVVMGITSTTFRRNQARAKGETPGSWAQLWPEAMLGGMLGLAGSVGLPQLKPEWFANFAAELVISMLGGWLGPLGWAALGKLSIRVGYKQAGMEPPKEDKDDGTA